MLTEALSSKQLPPPILFPTSICLSFLTPLRVQPTHGFHRWQWVPSYNLDSTILSELTTGAGPHQHFRIPFQALTSMSPAPQAPVLDSITSLLAQPPAPGATPLSLLHAQEKHLAGEAPGVLPRSAFPLTTPHPLPVKVSVQGVMPASRLEVPKSEILSSPLNVLISTLSP